jgi:DNA-binding response OmpR family regulator
MRRVTVLIIEDDNETRGFLRDTVLKPVGYRVLTSTDGEEGLKRALTDSPDLILLDLTLPRLPGLALLSQLRAQQRHIPAIVLTAHSSDQAILEAFRLGAKDLLQKPFKVADVRSAVENALAEEHLRKDKESLTQALAQANQRLQQQVHNWMALNEIAQAITSTLDEPEVFRRVMENVNRILQVEAGSLLLIDQKTGELEFKVTLKGDTARYSSFRRELGEGITGWVAEHGEPLLIPDVCQVFEIGAPGCLSILCVPLKIKEQVIGVIEVTNKQTEPEGAPFTQEDQDLLTTLASWVAVAVENAELNRATQKTAATNALRQTVTTLAHHINNQLMAFSLDLDGLEDSLESEDAVDQEDVNTIVASARRCIHEISAVVKALDRLVEIRTKPYVGTEEMIDIAEALEKQLHGCAQEPS